MKKEIFVWVSIFLTIVGIVSAAEFNIVIDGDGAEWSIFETIIKDTYDATKKNPSDIINVKGFTYNNYFYLRYKTNGAAIGAGETAWVFRVDINNDGKEEYQSGFTSEKAWIWDLRGSGYSDESNLKFITDFEVGIDKAVEFKVPLSEIGGKEEFNINVGSFKEGKTANTNTQWGSVKPFELTQLKEPTTTAPPTTTLAPTTTPPTTTPAPTTPTIAPVVVSKKEEIDTDGDGWTDEQEKRAGTNPFAKDTDRDGLWDSKDPNPLEPSKVPEEKKRVINWEQVGVILAVIGASIGGLLTRRKRGHVKKLLDDIDKAYESFRMNSRRCEAELYRLREVVTEQLKNGKINEESYSILDKRIDDYLGEIRERIMGEKFGSVPSRLKDEVHRMLQDGEISEGEYKAFENILAKSKSIGKKEKSELKGLFKKWKDEDRITGPVLNKLIDEYIKDIDKIDSKVSGGELKAEIDKIMEDGIVTQEEYKEFSKMLDSSDLSEEEKEGLKRKLRKIRDLTDK